MGHTPTPTLGKADNEMMLKCQGRFILTDVAMSRWMGGAMPAVLEIILNEEDDYNSLKKIRAHYVDGVKDLVDPSTNSPLNYGNVDYNTYHGGETRDVDVQSLFAHIRDDVEALADYRGPMSGMEDGADGAHKKQEEL